MLIAKENDGLVWIEAGAKLDAEVFETFVPLFERIAERRSGTVPMLIELKPDFNGWNIGGLWRDLKFDIRHKHQFGRIAIVVDRKWVEWGTKFSAPLFSGDMRYFDLDDIEKAEDWARAGSVEKQG